MDPDHADTAPERAGIPSDLPDPAAEGGEVLPFSDLEAPLPTPAAPEPVARWLAFVSIVLGGGLGALIGYGTGDVLGGSDLWAAIGAMIGAIFAAVGVGIVVSLTLRAMGEWNAVQHPEAGGRGR